MEGIEKIKALTFDVFGTIVDWRTSITKEGEALGARLGIERNWTEFADTWRGLYQPSMSRVRSGERPWTKLDDLHRESLVELLERFDIQGLDAPAMDDVNRAWHRLDPWPDSVSGLTRLRKCFILATLSNGNVSLLVNMAKRAGLPWDAVLGAEVAGHYKPQPEAYRKTAQFLSLEPSECMLVAAHDDDLLAARAVGFRTAFVARPVEYGPAQTRDVAPQHDFDYSATSLIDLADQLQCPR